MRGPVRPRLRSLCRPWPLGAPRSVARRLAERLVSGVTVAACLQAGACDVGFDCPAVLACVRRLLARGRRDAGDEALSRMVTVSRRSGLSPACSVCSELREELVHPPRALVSLPRRRWHNRLRVRAGAFPATCTSGRSRAVCKRWRRFIQADRHGSCTIDEVRACHGERVGRARSRADQRERAPRSRARP